MALDALLALVGLGVLAFGADAFVVAAGNVSHVLSEQSSYQYIFRRFADLMKERSQGKVTVRVQCCGQAGTEPWYGVVVAPRTEFVGRPDGAGSFATRLTVRESRARLQPKVAHRAEPGLAAVVPGVAVTARSASDLSTERLNVAHPHRPVTFA